MVWDAFEFIACMPGTLYKCASHVCDLAFETIKDKSLFVIFILMFSTLIDP